MPTEAKPWREIGGINPELTRGEPIPFPEKVIALDLNRTMLGADDKLVPEAVPALREVIAHARKEGIEVIGNSDSPLPPLYRLMISLGASGSVLAENGALYFSETSNKAYPLVEIPHLDQIRESVTRRLMEEGIHVFPSIVAAEFGEPTPISATAGTRGIAQGKYRLCTGTYFGLQVNEAGNAYVPDSETAEKVADMLEETLPPEALLYRDLDPDVAYLAVHPVYPGQTTFRPNKALGIAELRKHNPNARVFKIGDDERDLTYGVDKGFIYTGMVANAKPEHKNEADYVATKPYTEGVVELMQKAIEVLKD